MNTNFGLDGYWNAGLEGWLGHWNAGLLGEYEGREGDGAEYEGLEGAEGRDGGE